MAIRTVAIALLLAVGSTLVAPPVAGAAPGTPVRYPGVATATWFSGLAFDTCTAPSIPTMRAWRKSKYRAVAIYIGGPVRACGQARLTKSWVTRVTAMGWRLIPIYVGLQAPCRKFPKKHRISLSRAEEQGRYAAGKAVRRSHRLGLLGGSAIYLNMESYPYRPNCRKAVLRYASGWTRGLHREGYLAGVYGSLASGGKDLAQSYRSRSLARPDALWVAHWNKRSSLHGWPQVPNALWPSGQRGKQYRGGHREKHGGQELTVDSNRFDAPVATVARRFPATGKKSFSGRVGPSTKGKAVSVHRPWSRVTVVCQARGQKNGSTRVWNKLGNGAYVSDRFVATPSKKGFSRSIPRCAYPYQVTAPEGLNKRKGKGTSYPKAGRIPTGGLVRVVCQANGDRVLGTRVWNKVGDGRWVNDYYVATPGRRGFSEPLPRC